MHSPEIKKQILKGFIEVFPRISNKEFQRRVWIEGRGPECDDFIDTCCDFFGVCDDFIENYKDFGITNEQRDLLVKFRDEFRKFSDEHDFPQLFIDTPEWGKITDMAKEVMQAFNYQEKPYS